MMAFGNIRVLDSRSLGRVCVAIGIFFALGHYTLLVVLLLTVTFYTNWNRDWLQKKVSASAVLAICSRVACHESPTAEALLCTIV